MKIGCIEEAYTVSEGTHTGIIFLMPRQQVILPALNSIFFLNKNSDTFVKASDFADTDTFVSVLFAVEYSMIQGNAYSNVKKTCPAVPCKFFMVIRTHLGFQ